MKDSLAKSAMVGRIGAGIEALTFAGTKQARLWSLTAEQQALE